MLYVGRVPGPGGKVSEFANPFKVGKDGSRQEVVNMFLKRRAKDFNKEQVERLKGRTLLCHCEKWEACHADILVDLAELCNDEESDDEEMKAPEEIEVKGSYVLGSVESDPVMLEYIDDGLPVRPGGGGLDEYQDIDPCGSQGPRKTLAPPRAAHFMGRDRPYEDGGGLCSLGRFKPQDRPPAAPFARELLEMSKTYLEEDIRDRTEGRGSALDFVLRVAAGKFLECPFQEKYLGKLRTWIQTRTGATEGDARIAEGQAFRLKLIGIILKTLGDPDWGYPEQLEKGVPLGVGIDLPRTPYLYNEKVKWNLDEDYHDMVHEVGNYGSVKGHEKEVLELFREEERLGWMKEVTDEEARKEYGENLFLAGLGVVVEKDKIRVVHDGSNGVKINNRIRLRDQVRTPTAGELRTIMREREGNQFMIVGDVSKAHRRVKVRQEDWGYQACRLRPGHVWLNCVGTYGVSSAGYWWSRLAAGALVRMFYLILAASGGQDCLLFADDIWMIMNRVSEMVDVGALIFLWVALGVPWKWKKWRGGHTVQWIGYTIDYEKYTVGISGERARWLTEWMEKVVKEGMVSTEDFRAVLGRLSFSMGVLEYLKPFLSPLFAWISALPYGGRTSLPWSVSFVLAFLCRELRGGGRVAKVVPRKIHLGTVFRADAKAEGTNVVLGGWESRNGCPPSSARWFRLRLTRSTAPWAFARGEPYRAIAALELFASLVSFMLFVPEEEVDGRGTVALTGMTDNLGNVSALSRLMSSKFPLVLVLAEFAAQLRHRRAELDLLWIPREQNEPADALTNDRLELFDAGKEVKVEVESLPFLVLPELIKVADALYAEVRKRREGRTCPHEEHRETSIPRGAGAGPVGCLVGGTRRGGKPPHA